MIEKGKKIRNIFKELNLSTGRFFLCPFILLISLQLMHMFFTIQSITFFTQGNPLFKFLVSYIFLLAVESGLLAVVQKISIANLIMTVVFYTMGLANEVMCILTGDPLLPTDFLLLGNLGNIVSFVEIEFRITHLISLIICIGSVVLFFFLDHRRKKRHPERKIKLPLRAVLSVAGAVFFVFTSYTLCLNKDFRYKTLSKNGVKIAAFNPKADYFSNGLILTFFPRIGTIFMPAPDDYSKETMEAIKDDESKEVFSASENVKPNIIAIQNEAWWDSSLIPNAEFSRDPLLFAREIMAEGKGGYLVSPVFAGGTCMPEFEFLTGFTTRFLPDGVYPYIQSITEPTPSLASVCKDNGYETIAYHPYHENFYGRNKAYPLMGFDDFIGMDDLKNPEKRGWYISDMQMTEDIIRMYEEKKEDRIFIFGLSMQNHGDYTKKRYENYDIQIKSDAFSENDFSGLNDFTQGVYDTDMALKKLVDYFRDADEPTIIVMYGDHLPLLGTDGSTYRDGGFIENDKAFNYQKHEQMFKTPYVVWANYDISAYEFPEEISAGNLGIKIANMANLENLPWYYPFLNDFYLKYPVFENPIIKDKNLKKTDEISKSDEAYEKKFELIEFDIINGKQYSIK